MYLTSGQGFQSDNFTKLYQVRRCSSFYLAHLAMFGDFNEEPSDWPPSLHQALRTQTVIPQGTKGTCNAGQMRMLDYGIVHQPVASLFQLVPDWYSPMSPHLGIWGSFSARPRSLMHRVLLGPKEFPFIEVHNQEQARLQEQARTKKTEKATATLKKRLQAWLEKYAPNANHEAILFNPLPDAIPAQHPPLEVYLELALALQEAKFGVLDSDLDPSQDDPEEHIARPPPLAPEQPGMPAPGTPPPDWLLPDWYRDEWIPPEVPKGPRQKPQGMRLHQPPAFSEIMMHPAPWDTADNTQSTPSTQCTSSSSQDTQGDMPHFPLPRILAHTSHEGMLQSFQEVSVTYAIF